MNERGREAPGHELIGRNDELAQMETFLHAPGAGVRGLVIRGEPGIGKTAMWRAGLDRLRGRGYLALVARPAEEELPTALTGLVDLFGDLRHEPALLDPDTDIFVRREMCASAVA